MTAAIPFLTPEACEAAFYAAFRGGDFLAMRHVWIPAGDIVCIHPARPPLSGQQAVMQSWENILGATGGVEIRFECHNRAQSHDLAVHIGVETIGGRNAEAALVTVTNIYALTAQGWKMRAHHAGPIHRGAAIRGAVH
jgi:ketosteroid isomerase-like protein